MEFPFGEVELMTEADELCAGHIRYFSHLSGDVGDPSDWFCNPFTGQDVHDRKKHWTEITVYDEAVGDIKYIWEPSRFSWAPVLARAYRVSGNEKYLQLLQNWAVDWLEMNPVNIGPNWMCGQECSIRLMNLLLTLHILNRSNSPGSEAKGAVICEFPWSREWLFFFIEEHLRRIAGNIYYAISQQNNHGTSEAAGLYIGGLFLLQHQDEFKSRLSKHFLQLGRKWLERLVEKLIYDDGSFSQHSLNYHRVLIDTLSMVCFWNRTFKDSAFSDRFYKRFRESIRWLYYMTDDNGYGLNLGSNDGALLFHLTSSDYRDFRPCLEFARCASENKCFLKRCSHHEAIFWTFGDYKTSSDIEPRISKDFSDGGYIYMRGVLAWGMLRYTNYNHHHPSHADALNFDLWYNGINILRDSGSYSYNCETPWDNYFVSTKAHNTVGVDDRDQMIKYSRFLWINWTKSHLRYNENSDRLDFDHCEVEHYGYGNGKRGVLHRRAVVRCGDAWAIVDDLIGSEPHKLCLRWRLQPGKWYALPDGRYVLDNSATSIQVVSINSCDIRLATNEDDPDIGWESLYYGERHPIPCIVSIAHSSKHRWITLIGCNGIKPEYDPKEMIIKFNDKISFNLFPPNINQEHQLKRHS